MSFTVLSNGQLTDAIQVNNNFYHIRQGSLLPMGAATMASTTGVYDLGSISYQWNNLYAKAIPAGHTFTVSGELHIGSGGSITYGPTSYPIMVLEERYTADTASATLITSSSWFYKVINTITVNNISGATMSASQVTLPPGSYKSYFSFSIAVGTSTNVMMGRVYDTISGNTLYTSRAQLGSAVIGTQVIQEKGFFIVSNTATVEIQYFVQAGATPIFTLNPLGLAATSLTSYSYLYAEFEKVV